MYTTRQIPLFFQSQCTVNFFAFKDVAGAITTRNNKTFQSSQQNSKSDEKSQNTEGCTSPDERIPSSKFYYQNSVSFIRLT